MANSRLPQTEIILTSPTEVQKQARRVRLIEKARKYLRECQEYHAEARALKDLAELMPDHRQYFESCIRAGQIIRAITEYKNTFMVSSEDARNVIKALCKEMS